MVPHFFRVMGSDRCLTAADVDGSDEPHPLVAPAWDVYTTHFGGFTGASVDARFNRLSHPATRAGRVRVDADESVLVVGAGASLLSQIDDLKRTRDGVRVLTSLAGADVLLAHGIVPDLVLAEPPADGSRIASPAPRLLGMCPLVAAEWRTPASHLAGASSWSLFVPDALPTWGLWPATAVALACGAGAERVALVGVDLGTAAEPETGAAPLRALLELLALLVPGMTFDCGAAAAELRGWTPAAIGEMGGARVRGPLEAELYLAPGAEQRLRDARAGLAELEPVVQRAARLRALALEASARPRATWVPSLGAGVEEIMGWRLDPRVRVLLQECLGASFLARAWRTAIEASIGEELWRPLFLATDGVVAQADALATVVAAERVA